MAYSWGKIVGITIGDLQISGSSDGRIQNLSIKHTMEDISTLYRDLCHAVDAAKVTRKCCCSIMDHVGVNSTFLTVTPCDKYSFCVWLYCKPGHLVSSISFYSLPRYFYYRYKSHLALQYYVRSLTYQILWISTKHVFWTSN